MNDTEEAPQEPEATPTEGEQPAAEAAEATEAEAPTTSETAEPEATPTEGEQPAAEAGTEEAEAPKAEGEESSKGE